MKIHNSYRLLATLLFIVTCGCHAESAFFGARHGTEILTIVHTNDMHAHLTPDRKGRGGFANVAAYIKQVKKSEPNVLVLDAGDMTQGSPVSSIFYGEPIFNIMNTFGYDAATLGNHEFDNGAGYIAKYCAIAHFPLISSNVRLDGQPITQHQTALINVHGIKVGLLGLTTHEHVDAEGVTIEQPEAAIRGYLPELRKKADLVVAISHLGVERDKKLAENIQGLDVIVGGHSHTPLYHPLKVGQTLIVQAGYHALWVGRLDLTIDKQTNRILSYQDQLVDIPMAGLPPNPETTQAVKFWEDKVSKLVNIKIGHATKPMTTQQLRQVLERIWQDAYNTDFAFQNEGGTRASLAAGDLFVRDIWTILPFNNTLVILELTRSQVIQALGEVPFDENKSLYTLITNSYAGKELARQFNLPPSQIHPINISWRQPVLDFVKKHGNLNVPTRELLHQ